MVYNKYNKMQDECQNVWIMLREHLNTAQYVRGVWKCKTELQSHSYSAYNIKGNQYKYWKLLKWAHGERRVLPTWRAVRYPLNGIEDDCTNGRLEQPVAWIGRDNRPSEGKVVANCRNCGGIHTVWEIKSWYEMGPSNEGKQFKMFPDS